MQHTLLKYVCQGLIIISLLQWSIALIMVEHNEWMMSNIYYYLSFQKEVIFAEKFWQKYFLQEFFFANPEKKLELEPAKI